MLDAAGGGGPGAGIGQVVQALVDVAQCIAIILSTLPGEDPFRPTFGVNLLAFLDKPLPAVIPAIVGMVTQAVEQWEPRVEVLGVGVTSAGPASPGKVRISVRWRIDWGAVNAPSEARMGVFAPQTTAVMIG